MISLELTMVRKASGSSRRRKSRSSPACRRVSATVEDKYGDTPAQRAELDWLLYNKPLEYAQMVLRGEIEHYLSLGCDHGRSEN